MRSRPIARAMLRWFAVFILSLMQSLRGEEDSEQLQAAMTASELQVRQHMRHQMCASFFRPLSDSSREGKNSPNGYDPPCTPRSSMHA